MVSKVGHPGFRGNGFNPALHIYCRQVIGEMDRIEPDRISGLEAIGEYMVRVYEAHGKVNILMVCTHNSRRSHLAQLWLQTAGYFYGLEHLNTFSGGTEATAVSPRVLKVLQRAGFTVTGGEHAGNNRPCLVRPGEGFSGYSVFSKVYDDDANPERNFGAVMVCSEAEKNCPFIPGAEQRFSLPYVDPKHADGSPGEETAYDLASFTIAREMFFIARFVKERVS